MSIKPTTDNLNTFLHFGWLPRTDAPPPIPVEWIPQEARQTPSDPHEGADILRRAVETQLGRPKDIVIPLSGGLDSRTMLAIAREQGHRITTATLGVPGTYDYDIGAYVAKKLSLPHQAYNVNELLATVSTSDIVKTVAKTGDWGNSIETYANLRIAETFAGQPIVSGFLGDFIGGSYARFQGRIWDDAVQQFCRDASTSRQFPLLAADFSISDYLSQTTSPLPATTLSPYETLVLTARHTCSLRPTLYPHDFGYVMPFRDRAWIEFMFSAPTEERIGLKLYRHILATTWPELFSLPTKSYKGFALIHSPWQYRLKAHYSRIRAITLRKFPIVGERIFGIDPMHNYTDWHNQFMYNKHFRELTRENLTDLAARQCIPWIPIPDLITKYLEHTNRIDYNISTTLLVLLNLEINLKT